MGAAQRDQGGLSGQLGQGARQMGVRIRSSAPPVNFEVVGLQGSFEKGWCMGSKQIQGPQGAWGHAKQTSAPAIAKAKQGRAMDPSRGPAPNSGQTAGGGPRKTGSGKD